MPGTDYVMAGGDHAWMKRVCYLHCQMQVLCSTSYIGSKPVLHTPSHNMLRERGLRVQKALRRQHFLWQLFHLDKDLEASRAEVGSSHCCAMFKVPHFLPDRLAGWLWVRCRVLW